MDRGRYRAFLSVVGIGSVALGTLTVSLRAQGPATGTPASTNPSPTPLAATATPWVQASPPPATSPAKPPHADKTPVQNLVPTPSASPFVSPSKDEIARMMARKREEELARQPGTPARPPRTMPSLTSEEREAYERNLNLWQALPPEEKQALRGLATERIREETVKAYEGSGLNLNEDQREVFALRYRQERRRLEREIQEKAMAERARRLPEIMERLRHEFPASSSVNTPKPSAKPTPLAPR